MRPPSSTPNQSKSVLNCAVSSILIVGGESGFSVALTNEVCDPGVGFGQRLLVRQEHDAEMLGARFLAEAGAVNNHDVLLADQFFHEDLVTLRDLDARESIER